MSTDYNQSNRLKQIGGIAGVLVLATGFFYPTPSGAQVVSVAPPHRILYSMHGALPLPEATEPTTERRARSRKDKHKVVRETKQASREPKIAKVPEDTQQFLRVKKSSEIRMNLVPPLPRVEAKNKQNPFEHAGFSIQKPLLSLPH